MNIRRRKLILSATLAVSVLGAGTFAYGSLGGSGSASQSATRLVAATVGSVQSSISTSGTLGPATSLDLNFQNAGTLTMVTVEVGDTVTAGQVLAMVDDTSAKVDLEKAKANLLAAKDKLAAVKAGTTTSQSSTADDTATNGMASAGNTPGGSSSSTTSMTTPTTTTTTTTTATTTTVDPVAVAQATAGVHQAELAVEDAQDAVDATTLKAPMSGTITALNYTVGQEVNGGGTATSSSGAAPFATLVDATKMVVSVSWAETDAGKIAVGQTAMVEIDSLSRTVNGSVTSIAITSTVADSVVTYAGVVTLDEVPDGVKSGMSATVKVVIASKDGVIIIPSAAMTTTSGTSTVTVYANGQNSTRAVTLGLKGDGSTEVVSGLSAGEQLVMSVGTVSATASSSDTSGGAASPGVGGSTVSGGFGGGPPTGS